jgi:selenocysteine lyase/cysteine desulfurase
VVRGLGQASGNEECVRVTPALYTAPADLDALVAAIRQLAQ